MEHYIGFICLLYITVCRGNEQILSTSANSSTSPPALDDNSLTAEATRSYNPQPVTATSAHLVSQTSGPQHVGSLGPSSMAPSDYGSGFLTYDTNSVHTTLPSIHSSDVIVSSSMEHIAITQTYFETSSMTSVTSVSERSHVMLTTTPHVQVVSSIVSISPSTHTLDSPVQPSSTMVSLMSSSVSTGQQLTFTESKAVDNVVSNLSVIPTPVPSISESPVTSQPVPSSTQSVVERSTVELSEQLSLMYSSASHLQTSDWSEQKQESTRPLQERYQSTVMIVEMSTGWGRFMDQVTESQVEASSQTEFISSQAAVLSSSSSVIEVSSSVVVKPSVFPSTQSESLPSQASGLMLTSSEIIQVSSAHQVMSTEMMSSVGSVEVSQQTSVPVVQRTETVSVSSSAEIVSSTPPELVTEGVSVTATSELSYISSVTEQVTEHVSSSSIPVRTTSVPGVSTSGEVTHESLTSEMISSEYRTPSFSSTQGRLSSTPMSTSIQGTSSQPTSSIFVLPTSTVSVSSSVPVYPGSTSTTHTPSTTAKTTSTTPHELKDCYFQLTFDIECGMILNNTLVLAEFVGSLEQVLEVNLKVAKDKIKLYDPMCGSLIIHVGFTQVPYTSLKHILFSQFQQKTFEVPVMIDNEWLRLLGVKVIEIAPPTAVSPIDIPDSGLDKVDLIVIIVACCICGILITIGIILCAKECYRRKYAQSFDLLEIPHVNLKLEDFTLTRIPRPKAVYGDESVTMQAYMDNSSNRIVKNNGHQDTNGGGLHSNDVHVRMKQNKDGLVVGVTGYSSQKNGVSEKGAKRNNSMCSESSHPGDPATENLLHKGGSSTPMGAHNPIFVDDESLSNSTEEQSKKE